MQSVCARDSYNYGSMVKQKDSSCHRKFMKTHEELKENDSIHTTKGDKMDALVIMDKEDYNRKMTSIQ